MMIFRGLERDVTFTKMTDALKYRGSKPKKCTALLRDILTDMIEEAERYSLKGNLADIFFAVRLALDDGIFARAAEFGGELPLPLMRVAASELHSLRGVITEVALLSESELPEYTPLLNDYSPSGCRIPLAHFAESALTALAADLGRAESADELVKSAAAFYASRGSGIFALHRAFKWSGDRLVPISDIDAETLDSLVGYDDQKSELLANTELFVSGRAANNVLLFGDSGTGKSSSVKALLNESDLSERGLRMIEVRKEQYRDIPAILDCIRERSYRFILFLDDLSFEEFEVEYKYLKAIIEGGLERKPDNAVIYATSNRRNLVREVWKDRKAASDDVHGGDTMQERLSLADRFGVTIWYGAAGKDRYLDIVRTLAERSGLDIKPAELEYLALRAEVGRGGFTGRVAKQFITSAVIDSPKGEVSI